MARRRGVPSDDPDAVERRSWHLELQKKVFRTYDKSRDRKEDVVEVAMDLVLPRDNDPSPEGLKSTEITRDSRISLLNKPEQLKARLLCFHGFGGGAQLFNSWAVHLEQLDIELSVYNFPGRGVRINDLLLHSVMELVEDSCDAIASWIGLVKTEPLLDVELPESRNHVPIFAFGHSLGAIVAFEALKLLKERHGFSMSHLMVSQCRAPQIQSDFNSSIHTVKLHLSSEKSIRDRIINLGCIPEYMMERMDMLKTYYPIFISDYQAFESYEFKYSIPDEVIDDEPKKVSAAPTRANYGWEDDEDDMQYQTPEVIIPYPMYCAITVFGSKDDELVRPDHLKEWLKLTRAKNSKCFLYEVGGHFFLKNEQNKMNILDSIENICLGRKIAAQKESADESDAENQTHDGFEIDRSEAS